MTTSTRAREVTEWFPRDIKPIHMGVYELLNTSTGTVFYARWIRQIAAFSILSGWSAGHMKAEEAAREHSFGLVQNRWPWRGLREPA